MTERVVVAQPLPTAGGRVIVSPFQFATDGTDSLNIEAWCSVTNATLVVQGRWFDESGKNQPFSHRTALTSNRVAVEHIVPLGAGYVVNLVAFVEGTTVKIGQVFTCIKLLRGFAGSTIVLGALTQGYVTHEQVLAWPGSPLVDSISTGGVIRAIAGTTPAAGGEISETVPTGARWQLLGLRAQLGTDATVANRRAILQLQGGGVTATHSVMYQVVPANTNCNHVWAHGLVVESNVVPTFVEAGLPSDAIMLAGDRVFTGTLNIQAGDQWTAPNLLVREWLEAS